MAKKRGEEESTSGDEGARQGVHHQLDQHQQVRYQQLHMPAPLHQHQLQVKVGQFGNDICRKCVHANHDENLKKKKQLNTSQRLCKACRIMNKGAIYMLSIRPH